MSAAARGGSGWWWARRGSNPRRPERPLRTPQTGETALLFCTTGVLLRMLEDDPDLLAATHVLVDEVPAVTETGRTSLMPAINDVGRHSTSDPLAAVTPHISHH